MKIRIGKVKFLRDTQEYKVPVFVDGIYDEAKSYYASDKDDAEATRLAMIEWAEAHEAKQ